MPASVLSPEAAASGIDMRLMQMLASRFDEEQQAMFVDSFCAYLRHDPNRDFVVDLDAVWTWLGFASKHKAKELLTRCFQEDVDYKNSLDRVGERVAHTPAQAGDVSDSQHGGQNRQTILMTVNCFKKLCMRANTAKASQVHDYYVKMEEVMHEYIVQGLKMETRVTKERTLLDSFKCKPVVYFGVIGQEVDGQTLGKFGYSGDIHTRTKDHKREIGDSFYLESVVECEHNVALEKKLKAHPDVSSRRQTKTINGKTQTELVALDETFDAQKMHKIMLEIKQTLDKHAAATELDRHRHEERMLELNVQMKRVEAEVELKKLDLELRKLELSAVPASLATAPSPTPVVVVTEPSPPATPPLPPNARSVLQHTLQGELVARHASVSAACRLVGGDRTTLARYCGPKSGQPHRGYVWRYEDS